MKKLLAVLLIACLSIGSTFTKGDSGTDHGSISGLADDDHTQYLELDGSDAMTGALAITGVAGGGSAAALPLSSASTTAVSFQETDGPADEKFWDIIADQNNIKIRAVNDANSSTDTAITIVRGTGATIASVGIGANLTADNLKTHTLIEQRFTTVGDNTTSATFVTLLSSAATTFSGRPILLILHVTNFSATASATVEFGVNIDGGADTIIGQFFHNNIGIHLASTGMEIITPTAGSHTINLRWRRLAGTGTITMDTNDQVLLSAIEL